MNEDYEVEYSVNVTDWMRESNLLPVENNFDRLLKGFLETPGRLVQPSYNFFVIILFHCSLYIISFCVQYSNIFAF